MMSLANESNSILDLTERAWAEYAKWQAAGRFRVSVFGWTLFDATKKVREMMVRIFGPPPVGIDQ